MAIVFNSQSKKDIASFISSKLSDGWLEIYGGPTLLSQFHLPIVAFSSKEDGGYGLSGEWSGGVQASGVADTFKIFDRNRTWELIGTVSSSEGSGNLKVPNTTLVFGQHLQVLSFNIEF